MAKPHLTVVLSFNTGYVDTMGFLTLAGLFTAHVTGNFVTLGAASVFGSSGGLAKLLALPVFCVVVLLTGLLLLRMKQGRAEKIRLLLFVQLLFLMAAAIMAVVPGPLDHANQLSEVTIGMTLESVRFRLNQTDSSFSCFRLSFRENRVPLFPDKL